MPSDLRSEAIVLRRTNYGESDRILNLLTPKGKVSALARGVRKEKSRLAGGIELFAVADIVVHQGRGSLGTLTSARTLRFYHKILSDLPRLELASSCLKQLDRAADQADNPEFFSLLDQILAGLNQGMPLLLAAVWFQFNLAQAVGENINLFCDLLGEDLRADSFYTWDAAETALRYDPNGQIGAPQIKLARLMLQSRLSVVNKINHINTLLPPLEPIAQSFSPHSHHDYFSGQ